MHQKSRIRAGRAKRGGKAAQGNEDLYFLFLRPRLPCCFPLAHVFLFLFLFSSARSLDMYTCLFRCPPSLISPGAAFAVQSFFFPFICRASGILFACFCVMGGRSLFWTSICGNQEHQGLFPSVQSIHLSASLLLTVSASVSARGGGGVPGARLFFLLSPPATGACVRVYVLCVV